MNSLVEQIYWPLWKNFWETESLPTYACYFNKWRIELLLILIVFLLKFHSYIMVI